MSSAVRGLGPKGKDESSGRNDMSALGEQHWVQAAF